MTQNNFSLTSKRKVLKLSATFFISLLVLSACKKEETEVGSSLQGEGLDVISIDTCTVLTYTDEVDSMFSDETAINLLGYYVDPVFGIVDCGIVSQIRLSASNPSFSTTPGEVVVDSVVLALGYSGLKWYGNLTDPITVEVYEVDEDLIRDDQDYFTWSDPQVKPADLVEVGSAIISPDVVAPIELANGDSLSPHLRIRLDTTLLGDNLVNINEAGQMSSDDNFISAFKGLYIKVDGSSLVSGQGVVLYFALESSLSKMTMYFHTVSDPSLQEYDFSINSSAARYNKITYDRTGTDVESVLMDSTQGQDQFYCQAGSAWGVIQFPHIMDLYEDSEGNEDRKIINKAILVIPVQDFELDAFNPSTALFIARIVNKSVSGFTRDYPTVSSIPVYDSFNKEFRFTMTQEIQGTLNGDIENKGYRIYPPSFFASSIERIIFNGPESTLKNKARLEITYTDY